MGLVYASLEGPVMLLARCERRSAGKLCDALLDQSQAFSSLKVMRCKVQRCHTRKDYVFSQGTKLLPPAARISVLCSCPILKQLDLRGIPA